MKRYAVCEAKHVVVLQNWNLLSYYMHKELPQDDAWRWEVGAIIGEVGPAGFCLSSLSHEDNDRVRQKLERETGDHSFGWNMGKATTLDDARRKAIDAHKLVCDLPLEPLMVDGRLAGQMEDGYGNDAGGR